MHLHTTILVVLLKLYLTRLDECITQRRWSVCRRTTRLSRIGSSSQQEKEEYQEEVVVVDNLIKLLELYQDNRQVHNNSLSHI